jgi:hypothetical protein
VVSLGVITVSNTINLCDLDVCLIKYVVGKAGGGVPEKHFLGSPPEETSPLILMITHRSIGEGSIGGLPKSFSGAMTPAFPTNNIFRHTFCYR